MRRFTGPTGRVAIVSDDLTGACDTAAQFCRAGARTAVFLSEDVTDPEGWDVIAFTTESRRALPTVAARRTREAVQQAKRARAERLFIKVDSTLRGAPGGIIEAAAMEFGVPYVLVAPAFPEQGRVVVGGWIRRDDTAIVDGMARLAETAIASIGHIPLRAIRSSMTAIAISPGLLMDNVALLLADAERDEDLWTLAEYAASTELSLVAGAAGLARYLAPFWCWESSDASEDDAWMERAGPVLVVVGTRNPVTQAQLAYLRDADDVIVVDIAPDDFAGVEDVLDDALARAPAVVAALTVPQNTGVTTEMLDELARIVVRAAIRHADDLRGLVTTGGATAVAICAEARAAVLRVVDEVAPGIPCSIIQDGPLAGVPIITKSGGFGGEDALAVACVWLLEEDGDADDEEEWESEAEDTEGADRAGG